jgi:hypothetical protein
MATPLLALALLATPALAPRGDDAPLTWGERSLSLDALPPELPEAARRALVAWEPFATSQGYRIDVESGGRLLVLTAHSSGRAARLVALVEKVLERFERELPAPAERLVAKGPALAPPQPATPKPAAGDQPLPEDPEDDGGEHPWKLGPEKPAERTSAPTVVTTWGALSQTLDGESAVLVLCPGEGEFRVLLAELARRAPHLEAWAQDAKAQQGFVLGDPLIGAYLENPSGVEEWNPDNELASRVARLLLLRRFGELPNWFVQGYAWHMELALLGGMYVFPWRDEWVWATEHSGWGRAVATRFAKKALRAEDFLAWRRGSYLEPEAKASWAAVEFLLAKEAARLTLALERLRVFREEAARVPDGPSRWRLDTSYEIPAADQHRVLGEVLGADYLQRATRFFREELAP